MIKLEHVSKAYSAGSTGADDVVDGDYREV